MLGWYLICGPPVPVDQIRTHGIVFEKSGLRGHRVLRNVQEYAKNMLATACILGEKERLLHGVRLTDGYRDWMNRSIFQKTIFESKKFLQLLRLGLRSLINVDQVILNGAWPNEDPLQSYATSSEPRAGSMLRRKWEPFMCRPLRWYWAPEPLLPPPSTGEMEFWTLIVALQKEQRMLRSFSCVSGLCPLAFHIPNPTSSSAQGAEVDIRLTRSVEAFSSLKELSLCLVACGDDLRVDSYDNLDVLSSLLQSLSGLQKLELDLPDDYERDHNYQFIFPPAGHWPHLTIFEIQNITVHLGELIRLLIIQMPNLRQLKLTQCIRLLEGRWQGLIELLKHACDLETLDIDESTMLLHGEEDNFIEYLEERNGFLVWDIDAYIVSGSTDSMLKHPCLLPNEQPQQSQRYLQELLEDCKRSSPARQPVKVIERSIVLAAAFYRRHHDE